MTFTAARAYFTFRTLRAIWGENQNDEDAYHAMRAAYHAWQRAEYARLHA